MISKPWYREPWPWILMAGPAFVVVAGVNMAVLAFTSHDGLVADDYYKQGLGINRVIAREERARALHVSAAVQFGGEGNAVRVTLASDAASPPALRLALVHPTRSGEDRAATLRRIAPGLYEGRIAAPRGASYHVQVEDEARTWRLAGRWHGGEERVTVGEVVR